MVCDGFSHSRHLLRTCFWVRVRKCDLRLDCQTLFFLLLLWEELGARKKEISSSDDERIVRRQRQRRRKRRNELCEEVLFTKVFCLCLPLGEIICISFATLFYAIFLSKTPIDRVFHYGRFQGALELETPVCVVETENEARSCVGEMLSRSWFDGREEKKGDALLLGKVHWLWMRTWITWRGKKRFITWAYRKNVSNS